MQKDRKNIDTIYSCSGKDILVTHWFIKDKDLIPEPYVLNISELHYTSAHILIVVILRQIGLVSWSMQVGSILLHQAMVLIGIPIVIAMMVL
jgi:hypothetical protein